jgi:hypothetical protein
VPIRYRKFAAIYCTRSLVFRFCRWHIVATQKQIADIIVEKIDPR